MVLVNVVILVIFLDSYSAGVMSVISMYFSCFV